MSWSEFILKYPAALVIEATGAPKRTVYDWRNGRQPPEWMQAILRPLIEAKAEQSAAAKSDRAGGSEA